MITEDKRLENPSVIAIITGLEDRNDKTITRKTLAERYGVTTRTITNKLKSLGFKWTGSSYKFLGDEANLNDTYNIRFNSLFESNSLTKRQSIDSENNSINKSENDSNNNSNNNNKTVANTIVNKMDKDKQHNTIDDIDRLLAGDGSAGRTYKGYYIDNDLVEVIDKVGNRKRSDLINMCLRKVFEEKGLL